MTERSKNRRGGAKTADPQNNDRPSLRGLERRTRVSRRAAPRRKHDDDHGAAKVAAQAAEAGVDSGNSAVGNRSDSGVSKLLRAALDRVPNCLAVCDSDMLISHVNPGLENLLRGFQSALRQRFPGFDAGTLVGSRIDRFHPDPEQFRQQLDACGRLPQTFWLDLGELGFAISCSALLDANDRRIGTLVEWLPDTRNAGASE